MGRSAKKKSGLWALERITRFADLRHDLKLHSGLMFIVGFGITALFGMLRHELWEDELQAWMLARDSTSVLGLIHNMRFEGHPMLWHLLLLGLVKISHDPVVMQFFNLIIGISTACLVNYYSPFTTKQKFFLTFSYFILYEYTVISRSYGLGVLLAFLFCALTTRLGDHLTKKSIRKFLFLRILVLVALANTSLYGLLISIALSIYLVGEWGRWGWICADTARLNFPPDAQSAFRMPPLASVTLIGGWFLSAVQIFRAFRPELLTLTQQFDGVIPNNFIQGQTVVTAASHAQASLGSSLSHITKLGHLTAYVWKSYIPIPQLENPSFWNTSVFSDTPFLFGQLIPGLGGINFGQALSVLLSVLLLFFVFTRCLHNPIVKLVYVVGNVLMFSLFYFFLPTGIRHHGHLFILLLLCFWLDQSWVKENAQSKEKSGDRLVQLFLSVILFIQALVGGYAYSVDWRYEFTGAAQAVKFLRNNGLESLPIVGMRTWETSVFSGYLDRQIYYPELGHWGSFVTPPSQYPSLSESWAQVRELVSTNGTMLIILDKTISIDQLAREDAGRNSSTSAEQVVVRLLGEFDGEIVTKETYLIYLVQSERL